MNSGWARIWPGLSALLAGGLTTLGFAPFGLWPLAIIGPAGLFWLWSVHPGPAFRLGLLFGLGLMASGVTWLHVSIAQFGNVGWFFPLLVTGQFVLLMSLYYGLAGWLSRFFADSSPGLRLGLAYPALYVLAEWLRGWFLSGFPWLELGCSQLDTPLAGYGPLLGGLGVSWAVALSAGLLVLLGRAGRTRGYALASLLLLWAGGWGLLQIDWGRPLGRPLKVALVQGNIPQHKKWDLDQLTPSLALYARLSEQHLDRDLIVWPETAVSAFQYQVDEAFLKPLEQVLSLNHSQLVFGVVRLDADGERYYNAMVSMGAAGRDHYYKRHLVPFTEYLPLKSLLSPLEDFFTIPMSDFTPGRGKPLMQVGSYPVGMSICYEDAFGSEQIQALPQAAYLLNASNDAWFGDSLAPHQHLQIARMRALETGRYLLRATNTGISAIIGPHGELLAHSPLLQEDVLLGEIQPLAGATPYVRYGNLAILALLLLALMFAYPCVNRAREWADRRA